MKKLAKILLPIVTLSFLTSCSFGGGEVPEVKTYPVFFDGNGGTLVEGQELQFVHDPSEIVPPVYEKENYTFIGWDVDPTSVISLMKITAIWGEESEFIVYFHGDGGTRIGGGEEQQIVKDASEIVPPVYEKEGYEFVGWSQEISEITSTTIVTALWENENTFIVTFNGNGGTYVSGSLRQSVHSAAEIKPPVFEYPGHDFLGWDPPIDTITSGPTEVKAMWSGVNTYTIIWQNEDGHELEKDENVPYGTTPEYNGDTPVKPDPLPGYTYTFSGWTPSVVDVVGDATYKATFTTTPITYTITWKNWDGETTLDTDYVDYGATPYYDGPTPTRDRDDKYVYIWNGGWTPELETVTDNATYTATFDKYDIAGCTFVKNDGGTYTLTKYSGNATKLKITPVYDGIPVTAIGNEAFKSCTTLQEIVIPDSVLVIGQAAFSGCSSLTKVNIPDGVTLISSGAFAACENLAEITIPKNVTSIDFYAFRGCSLLNTINMLPTTPPNLGPDAFDNRPGQATFNVPKGYFAAYTTAGYDKYGEIKEKIWNY